MSKEYLGLPWSVEQTIKNMKELKQYLIEKVKEKNFEEKGEEDAKEIEFDFARAEDALTKSNPKNAEIEMVGTHTKRGGDIPVFFCPVCRKMVLTTKYCSNCGQRLIFPIDARYPLSAEKYAASAVLPVTEGMSQAFGENWPKPNFPLKNLMRIQEEENDD